MASTQTFTLKGPDFLPHSLLQAVFIYVFVCVCIQFKWIASDNVSWLLKHDFENKAQNFKTQHTTHTHNMQNTPDSVQNEWNVLFKTIYTFIKTTPCYMKYTLFIRLNFEPVKHSCIYSFFFFDCMNTKIRSLSQFPKPYTHGTKHWTRYLLLSGASRNFS